ncbi:hypothetical protein I204_05294 [Kwoniella mangroviensis CBS 8886]|uniref:uncharacterized protein n=1 Tax=Kwoniella mangroviensis CBS 8507 TaxID=1296122 RepID=UPI00080D55E8|nr:uncharacterized protein I203_04647 [Kwoniella mangroviensis CBS 8507]OCF66316.1 hypothetical protein I203_04647 [Kwoniella mangroviensis CBS 8507]OCF73453.1 hypothetical protein I204_05294 [Kwoniella mangroviensis CBS 8886]
MIPDISTAYRNFISPSVSSVFRAMLEIPQSTSEVDSATIPSYAEATSMDQKPIDMKCSPGALEGFLSILVTPIPMLPSSSLEDTYEVLRLCHRYGCKKQYTDKVRQRISEAADGSLQLWDVLEVASSLDDRSLGKMVLSQFSRADFMTSYVDGISRVNSAWKGKILVSCVSPPEELKIQVYNYNGLPFGIRKSWGWLLKTGEWKGLFDDFDTDNW